jgi:hypothetical protein
MKNYKIPGKWHRFKPEALLLLVSVYLMFEKVSATNVTHHL